MLDTNTFRKLSPLPAGFVKSNSTRFDSPKDGRPRQAALDKRNISVCIMRHRLFAEHADRLVLIGDHEETKHFKRPRLVASDGGKVCCAGAWSRKEVSVREQVSILALVAHLSDL